MKKIFTCKQCGDRIKKVKVTGLCIKCYSSRFHTTKDPSTWRRNCPKCGNCIIYTTRGNCHYSIRNNTICNECRKDILTLTNKKHCCICGIKIYCHGVTDYCNKCLHARVKQEAILRRTYICPKCGKVIFFKDNKIANKNRDRGYCYNCLSNKKKFITMVKKCVVCDQEFIILEYSKRGQKTCNDELCRKKNRGVKSTLEYIIQAKRIHGERYNYDNVIYERGIDKIEIICKIHGSFFQMANNHLKNRGCPSCFLYMSNGEYKTMEYLKKNNIIYSHQHKFNDCINPNSGLKLKYDFYIPRLNILIEYDGEQHFRVTGGMIGTHRYTDKELQNLRIRDEIKNIYAKERGIKLIRISYKDIGNIDKILDEQLYGKI